MREQLHPSRAEGLKHADPDDGAYGICKKPTRAAQDSNGRGRRHDEEVYLSYPEFFGQFFPGSYAKGAPPTPGAEP